jgi:O-antigen ligase
MILWNRHQTFNIIFTENVYIPTAINHVRFSLIVASSIFIGGYLWKYYRFHSRFEKSLLGVMTFFLLIFLHLIAVRSGVFGFYLALIIILLTRMKTKQIALGVLGSFIFLITTMLLFPSFKHETQATYQSLQAIQNSTIIENQSDFGRIESIKNGFYIARQNLLFGIGLGDIESEMNNIDSSDGKNWNMLPHNQFVFIAAFSGLFGLLWFSLIVSIILSNIKLKENLLLLSFITIIGSSFLFDHTLETQIGVGFSLIFLLIFSTKPVMKDKILDS